MLDHKILVVRSPSIRNLPGLAVWQRLNPPRCVKSATIQRNLVSIHSQEMTALAKIVRQAIDRCRFTAHPQFSTAASAASEDSAAMALFSCSSALDVATRVPTTCKWMDNVLTGLDCVLLCLCT